MDLSTIHVVQKHSLGIEQAKRRLKALAQRMQPEHNHIKVTGFTWFGPTNTLKFEVESYNTTVSGKVLIRDDYVEVVTDPLPPLAWLFIPFVQASLQSKLADALK